MFYLADSGAIGYLMVYVAPFYDLVLGLRLPMASATYKDYLFQRAAAQPRRFQARQSYMA